MAAEAIKLQTSQSRTHVKSNMQEQYLLSQENFLGTFIITLLEDGILYSSLDTITQYTEIIILQEL